MPNPLTLAAHLQQQEEDRLGSGQTGRDQGEYLGKGVVLLPVLPKGQCNKTSLQQADDTNGLDGVVAEIRVGVVHGDVELVPKGPKEAQGQIETSS